MFFQKYLINYLSNNCRELIINKKKRIMSKLLKEIEANILYYNMFYDNKLRS